MAGLVITIAQRKGGAGKTTLAAQLAVAWARRGGRVAALDVDPQGSLPGWVGIGPARRSLPQGSAIASRWPAQMSLGAGVVETAGTGSAATEINALAGELRGA
jgi:CO dehydrogenase nickel-insertion accessory protein CooC1